MKDDESNNQQERETKSPKGDRETAPQAELNDMKTQLDDLRDSGPPDSGSDVPPGTVGATEASVSIPGDAPDQSDSEAAEGLDLKKDGPTVIDLPPRMLGILDDMAFLYMTDLAAG